jgi:tetratricopeptide (TPR) repeat protein
LEADARNAAAHRLSAELKVAEGDFAGALGDLNNAISLDPNDRTAFMARAEIRVALQQQREQIEADFLASGGRQPDFGQFYESAVARLAASATFSKPAGATAKGAPAPDAAWSRWTRQVSSRGWAFIVVALALLAAGAWRIVAGRRRQSANETPIP